MPSPSSIERREAHWVEWVTGFASCVLVLFMVGLIFWEAVTDSHQPPALTVVITSRSPVTDGYRVTFDIANSSAATAAAVVVRGEIVDRDEVMETIDVSFDYVPAESKSSGAIVFSRDPADRSLRVRAVSYTEP